MLIVIVLRSLGIYALLGRCVDAHKSGSRLNGTIGSEPTCCRPLLKVCEVERELGLQAGIDDLKITFTAQVVPVCRGIMSTLYGTLSESMSEAEVLERYQAFYADSPFVRVLESVAPVGSMHVRGTNFCNLVVSVDERTNRLRVVSYIDNLLKGQAGSALQNMNLLFGLDETTGMNRPANYP